MDSAGKVTYANPSALPEGKFDDVIYFGSDAAICEKLFENADSRLVCIVQAGKKFGRPVSDGGGPRPLWRHTHHRHDRKPMWPKRWRRFRQWRKSVRGRIDTMSYESC